jgi:hypothetical protein
MMKGAFALALLGVVLVGCGSSEAANVAPEKPITSSDIAPSAAPGAPGGAAPAGQNPPAAAGAGAVPGVEAPL